MHGKRRKLLFGCLGSLLFALPLFVGAAPPEPGLPLPPAARLVWVAHATGVQVYKAQAEAGSSTPLRWVFQEPEAILQDPAGAQIGRHFRGPCWEAADGSRVAAKAPPVAQIPGRTSADVPWLVVSVHSTGTAGLLAEVNHVLRVDTSGGAAPAAPPTRAGETVRVPYRATYLFLSPAAPH